MQRKLISSDPLRPAILARLRAIWRHLPRDGKLLFFDVKPVVVKAYGGRRYTTAKRLILPRAQKTRGRCYLFAIYDIATGKVRWRFYPSKSGEHVRLFLKEVRGWYLHVYVCIALDQDPAHPRKCRHTRQTMRQLGLHWVSLPKGSPDDNPLEALFSDVQRRVLDNSNDPDLYTTKRRITAYLRRRNQRRDRYIRIPYLPDCNKK